MTSLPYNGCKGLPRAIAGLFVALALPAMAQVLDDTAISPEIRAEARHAPAREHNTWTSGAPMPTALQDTAVAVLENQIYVVGGDNFTEFVADTQIYDVATDTWSPGVPLPIATGGGCAASVKNVLYYIGGNTGAAGNAHYTNAVWAYHPKRKAWSSKAPMPTARVLYSCVVDKGIIYAMGGYNNAEGGFLATVESYDPATNTWAEDTPMNNAESAFEAGLIGTTIVVTDGSDGETDGHTQGYDVATNTWEWLTSDPIIRQDTCAASIGQRLYSAGGWDGNATALTVTESFRLSEDSWKTLTPIPQGTYDAGSVAYKGQMYCFGGANDNSLLNNVQIYQP